MRCFITKLQAINIILTGLGETEIETLDNPTLDISLAISVLERVTEEVQLHSWHFNTDENYTLLPDSNGYINLPKDVHQVIFLSPDSSYIKKGSRLYDKDLGTYKINKKIKANLIRILPFEDIPISFQHYIAIRAARKHQNNTLSSATISSFQVQDEAEAKLACMKEEQRVRKPKFRYKLSDLFK